MNTGRTSVLDRADQLIDANQGFCDGDRSLLIDVDLPVVGRLNSLVRRCASRSVTLRLTVATVCSDGAPPRTSCPQCCTEIHAPR